MHYLFCTLAVALVVVVPVTIFVADHQSIQVSYRNNRIRSSCGRIKGAWLAFRWWLATWK